MLNRDVLARDPHAFHLADGGVAKVSLPPDAAALPILREQLETFVCGGAYSDALVKILAGFNAVASGKVNTPAAWISGFYGSGKSLLASMLGALWVDVAFPDGRTAKGLVQDMPPDVSAALQELRTIAARLKTTLAVGGVQLGTGAAHPVKAVLGVLMRAAGLPVTNDLRHMQCALWLADQGILDPVRTALGDAFPAALETFLLDDRLAEAVIAAKPSLGPVDGLMDRLNTTFATEPEPTPDLLASKGPLLLTLGGKPMPLTLIILDEMQQFLKQDPNRSEAVQGLAEVLASRFGGRVLLVCTGQSALGDVAYLEKLIGRFPLKLPLGSSDIQSVIRKTLLRKKPGTLPAVEAMLEASSGELDKHLAGSTLRRTAADRPDAAADWPLLATRRRVWDRVLRELDRTGLGETLRSQLRITLDALKAYANHPLGTAVPGDFLLQTFGAEALSRQLIGGEFFTKVETQRVLPGDGPMRARILLLAYMLAKIAADAADHGVRATQETFADLLVEDMADASSLRARLPGVLEAMVADGLLIDVGNGEWRLQTKESAEWQAAFNKALAEETADLNAIARRRGDLLKQALDEALSQASRVTHGLSKTPRPIERVQGAAKPESGGLVLRLWNEWQHGTTPLDEIKGADPATDATIHLFVPAIRTAELSAALATGWAATAVLQRQGVPTTDGGREARAAMAAKLETAQRAARAAVDAAIHDARVLKAGGADAGIGQPRPEAVKAAAIGVLDRLYPDFFKADHGSWDRALTKTKAGVPDAFKDVDHPGDGHLHPVCQALLTAMGGGKTGADLRRLFLAAPYGWPKESVDSGLRMLALTGQVRVTDATHKPADPANANDQALGTYHFAGENRTVSTAEKMQVRGLAHLLGMDMKSGEELAKAIPIVERLAQRAAAAGGAAPAPAAPAVPGMAVFTVSTGNDLLAELAARQPALATLIPAWDAAAKRLRTRLQQWAVAQTLIALGAAAQQADAEAILANRSLLTEPDPVAPLVAAACNTLVTDVNAAHGTWRSAWDAGEAALKASSDWGRLTADQRHSLRTRHHLLDVPPPDLSTPTHIAASLQARSTSQWRDMAAAHPGRVQAALQDAAVELEPKTQMVAIPRATLRTDADLDAWLAALRGAIAPLLPHGPVLPTV